MFRLKHIKFPDLVLRLVYTADGLLVSANVADHRVATSPNRLLPKELPDPEDWHPRPQPLTVRRIRDLPLGAVDEAARADMARIARNDDERLVEDFVGSRRGGGRGRPRVHDDRVFAEAAGKYADLVGSGREVEKLADFLHVSYSTALSRVRTARQRGLLTSAPSRGRAGGRLTPRGRQLYELEKTTD